MHNTLWVHLTQMQNQGRRISIDKTHSLALKHHEGEKK